MSDGVAASGVPDPRYVAARWVLLNALSALAPHGRAVIVAGAQAVYLRAGSAVLGVAPYTTDGDLALDPSGLADDPVLETAMRDAGFELAIGAGGHVEPGSWTMPVMVAGIPTTIPVDLIVPEAVAPEGGRRGARLGVHGRRAARRAAGLEAALVDHSPLKVEALDPTDHRTLEVEVAGVAALLVAKAHKIGERVAGGRPARIVDKDAADVFRLFEASSPRDVAAQLVALASHPLAGEPSRYGLAHLRRLFGSRGRPGIEMAARALSVGVAPERVEAVCLAYVDELAGAIPQLGRRLRGRTSGR